MKKFAWLIILISLKSSAVNFPNTQGPISHGLGNISSLKTDPFAAYNHQGSLALSKGNYLSVSAKSLFFVSELNTACVAISKKINKTQTIGLGYSFFGNQYFNESITKLSFAKKFMNKTGGGISMDYYRLQLPKEAYKVKNIFTFEIGFYSELNKYFDVAFQLVNPARVTLVSYMDEKMPFTTNSAIFYKINEKLILAAEWCQTINSDGYSKFGIKYNTSKNFEFFAGVVQKTSSVSFGFNYILKKTIVAISFSTHPYLGSSSSAGFSYFKNYD